MKYTKKKLTDLQKELNNVVKEVRAGKLSQQTAADKIVNLKEEIDKLIEHLKSANSKYVRFVNFK